MREIDRNKRVMYNSMANGIYQIVLLTSGLILPRFILMAFGSAYNGLITSLMQFLGITEILTMGLAGAARAELYQSLAYRDIKRTSGIIKMISRYMYKAAGVFIIYMLVLLFIYPKFTQNDFTFPEIASLIIIIGFGNIVTYVCGYAYNVLLDADNAVYIYTCLKIVLTLVNVFVSILLIKCGQSIQVVKLASGLILAIAPLCLFLIVPKLYKLDKTVPVDDSWKKNQRYAAANSIALIVHDNTDAVLLTIFTSTKIVSVYSIYYLVIKGLKGILGIFTTSMEPLFGNMWANREYKEMENTLTHYEFFIGFFISVSLSSALALILPFVSLYTKGVTDVEYVLPLFAFLTIMAELVRCIRIPYLTVVQAAGKYKETQTAAFVEAGLNITISVALTSRFGLIGVIIGTLFANLYRTFSYSNYVSKCLLPRSMKHTFKLLAWTLFNILLNSKIFGIICAAIGLSITSWGTWIIGATIVVSISLIEVLLTSLLFYQESFKWLKKFVGRYFTK